MAMGGRMGGSGAVTKESSSSSSSSSSSVLAFWRNSIEAANKMAAGDRWGQLGTVGDGRGQSDQTHSSSWTHLSC